LGERLRAIAGTLCLGLAFIGVVTTWFGGFPWYLALLSYGVPVFAPLALLGLALRWRRLPPRGCVAGMACLIGGISLFTSVSVGSSPKDTGSPGATLNLYVANVYYHNHDATRLLNQIATEDPDVVLLQEVDAAWAERLRPLHTRYPGQAVLPRSPGGQTDLALYWRGETLTPPVLLSEAGLPAIRLRLQVAGQPVEILNVHTAAPFSPDRARRYRAQMAALTDYAAGAKEPLLLAGDLNSSLWSQEYRALTEGSGLRNAREGRGVLGTWPSFLGPLRTPLDHVLAGPHWQVLDCRVAPSIGSDHRPLIVRVALAAPGNPVMPPNLPTPQ
jgi:endonuclease/exonuclease/phosphatase (EEP) superfamily protein YafD